MIKKKYVMDIFNLKKLKKLKNLFKMLILINFKLKIQLHKNLLIKKIDHKQKIIYI